MVALVCRVLRLWWVFVGIAFAAVALIRAAQGLHHSIWFWLFLALVPVVMGITLEWHRLWSRANDERRILRGVGRRLIVELRSMESDLDRVETVRQYDGFVPLP